jgi:hypothetical protein
MCFFQRMDAVTSTSGGVINKGMLPALVDWAKQALFNRNNAIPIVTPANHGLQQDIIRRL